MSIQIRPYEVTDLTQFQALLASVVAEEKFLWLTHPPSPEAAEAFIAQNLEKGGVLLLALDQTTVVGWCDIMPRSGQQDAHVCELGMGVACNARGKGVGKGLLQACLAAADAKGFERVELEVFTSNHAAIKLYERMGFQHEGVKRGIYKYKGETRDMLMMSRLKCDPEPVEKPMKANGILERIQRKWQLQRATKIMANDLSGTDLQSLMLDIYRQRLKHISAPEVLADWQRNRFCKPTDLSLLSLQSWQECALRAVDDDMETLHLAPAAPIGSHAAVANIDPDWTIPAIRNFEWVTDPTNVMAVEAAARRADLLQQQPKNAEQVHLATCHRVTRPQFIDAPMFFSHFSLFALCSAGRTQGGLRFEIAALQKHIATQVRALTRYAERPIKLLVKLSDFSEAPREEILKTYLCIPLKQRFEHLQTRFDHNRQAGRKYYRDLCFKMYLVEGEQQQEIGDGGIVDWTAKLLSNRKERTVISGLGSDRVIQLLARKSSFAPNPL